MQAATATGTPAKRAQRQMDVRDVRRANLARLISQRGLKPLAEALGYTNGSYLLQMAGPHPIRPVSETNARRYEIALGLPAGALDRPMNGDEVPQGGWTGIERRAQPPAAPVAADTPVLTEVVRVTAQVLDDAHVHLTPEKFANLVTLALRDAAEHGNKPRTEFVKGLVDFVK